jgi:hypothetical protein
VAVAVVVVEVMEERIAAEDAPSGASGSVVMGWGLLMAWNLKPHTAYNALDLLDNALVAQYPQPLTTHTTLLHTITPDLITKNN